MPKPHSKQGRERTHANAVPWQLRESVRRAVIVCKALPMLRAGRTLRAAATRCRTPLQTLWRWVRAFELRGAAGLVPGISTGCPSVAVKVKLTAREARAIAVLARRGNIRAACRAYASRPACRAELRAVLTGRLPQSVRRAIRERLPKPDAPDYDPIWKKFRK